MKLFRRRVEDPMAALEEVLGTATLPSFPAVVTRAVSMLASPDTGLHDVGDVVATDPGVTVHLLKLVNSATYSPRHPVSSVHQAVALVGRNQLESLLITYAVGDVLPHHTDVLDMDRFWLVAARRAVAAGSLAGTVDPVHRSETFTAALLQDMAQPVLVETHPPYAELLRHFDGGHSALAAAELETLGWTHAEVGTWMCRRWGFPESLIAAIEGHHEEIAEPHAIVRWASRIGESGYDADRLGELAAVNLGVDVAVAMATLARAEEEAGSLAAMFR